MVAILGNEISLKEIWDGLLLLFVGVCLLQVGVHWNENIFWVLDKHVVGYPECESIACFAPNLEDVKNFGNATTDLLNPTDPISFVLGLLGTLFGGVWVVLRGAVIISVFIRIIVLVYQFWAFLGVFKTFNN